MRRRRVWRRARSMFATAFIAVPIVLLAVAALVMPLAGEAQQAASLPRVGCLDHTANGGADAPISV